MDRALMNTRVDAIIGNDARIFAPNSVILAQTVAGRASLVYAATAKRTLLPSPLPP
jgi:hypothetical protein